MKLAENPYPEGSMTANEDGCPIEVRNKHHAEDNPTVAGYAVRDRIREIAEEWHPKEAE